MKTSFYFSILAVCALLVGGCLKISSESKNAEAAPPAPATTSPQTTNEPTKNQGPKNTPVVQHSEEQEQLAKLDAAVCKIDIVNKTFLVMPWDVKTRKWKREPATILSWEDSTEFVKPSGINNVTMAKFVGGAPLDERIKSISDLKGERVAFYIHKVDEKAVVRKMEMIGLFEDEPIPAFGGNNSVQILVDPGASTKVQCDEGK